MVVLFVVGAFIILFKKRGVLFTHIEFFQKKRGFSKNAFLDILILLFVTLSAMAPYEEINKTSFIKSYFLNQNQDTKSFHIVLVMDVSLSMSQDFYFDDEKEEAIKFVKNTKGYFAVVAFEKDYKLLRDFTKIKPKVISTIKSLKPNMITKIGGSRLKDTIAYAINLVKYKPNPKIVIFSDGSENDESSITLGKLTKEAKKYGVDISYYPFGNSSKNYQYQQAFNDISKLIKDKKNESFEFEKKITYEDIKINYIFLYIAIFLLGLKLLYLRLT